MARLEHSLELEFWICVADVYLLKCELKMNYDILNSVKFEKCSKKISNMDLIPFLSLLCRV